MIGIENQGFNTKNKRSMTLNSMFRKENLGTPMGNEKERNTKRHFNTKLV